MDDDKLWRGVHVSELQTSLNFPQYPEVVSNDEHTILIKIPVSLDCIPECYPSIFNKRDFWDSNHVKLPCSEKNVTKDQLNRWNLIRNALNNRILSSQQFQEIVLSYNKRYVSRWNFSTLHSFFEEVCDENETAFFFDSLLPKIVELALCLPELITGGIPLLKQGRKHSVTLSQLQVSCLLSNAFLCTFPRRNSTKKDSEYAAYPDINFNQLFQCENEERTSSVHEKLKCLLNYFRRVTTSVPKGVVTYSRQFVPDNIYPNWSQSNRKLPKLYVSSSGTIEDDGFGLFQVDFANKFVGGGVIGTGCVQEEIRFVICPELILSRLFTECLGENEALVVTGCERFNKYKGYGQSFEWDGDYVDGTPSDKHGRKYCTVIALDALHYWQNPDAQYLPKHILRDINKAYVGFSWGSRRKKEELCAVATGNWGCGIFKGNPQLKSFLQLMAAAEVNRDLAYFTFGNNELRDSLASVYKFLVDNEVTVGQLYNFILEYNAKQLYQSIDLFEFFKSEASKISAPKMECERSQSNSRNSFGIPKLHITKRSFCCRTKINDWFSPLVKCDRESPKEDKVFGDSSVENELKSKETLFLTRMYQFPNHLQHTEQREQRDESDGFDFLNKFKMSLKKNSKVSINSNKIYADCDNELKNDTSRQALINNDENFNMTNFENNTRKNVSGLTLDDSEKMFISDSSDSSATKLSACSFTEENINSSNTGRVSLKQVSQEYCFQNVVNSSDSLGTEKQVDSSDTDEVPASVLIRKSTMEKNNLISEHGAVQLSTSVISTCAEPFFDDFVESASEFVEEKFKKKNACKEDGRCEEKVIKTVPFTSIKMNESFNKNLPASGKNTSKNNINVNNNFSKKRKISDYFSSNNKIIHSEIP